MQPDYYPRINSYLPVIRLPRVGEVKFTRVGALFYVEKYSYLGLTYHAHVRVPANAIGASHVGKYMYA